MACKEARVSETRHNLDRISSLPDGALCHILSFLPTKYSVRTSILSTRWKHLFTFVPNLEFYYSPTTRSINFIDFVNSVFVLYKCNHLNKFRFHFCNFRRPLNYHCPINLWISAAILRHVQEMSISVDLSVLHKLPLDLFSCKTLTILEISGNFEVVIPRSTWLPNLKTCCFSEVRFGEESAQELFQNCPKLENLDISSCRMGEVEVLDISVPNLKRLTIHETADNYEIVLNAPNLLYFEYFGPAANRISGIKSLNSVIDATIFYESGLYTPYGILTDLVLEVCNVRELFLSRDTMEAFFCSVETLRTFNNLTRLTLGTISSNSSEFIQVLLDKSPRLEFLSFNQGSVDDDNEAYKYHVLPKHVPTCVSKHIKEIEFRCFSTFEYDFKIVEYFLKNAMVLDKMKIQSSLSCEMQLEVAKKVSALPRCSTACKVYFE